MKKGAIWIIVAALVLAAWFGAGLILAVYLWERNSEIAAGSTKYTVHFGKVSDDDDHPKFMEELTVLPLHYKDSGFRYGIEIVPSVDDKPYTFYCVFHFSKPPKILSGGAFEGKEPSTTLQTTSMDVPGGDYVDNYWFDPGDPVGEQSVDVFINDKLVKTINYTVIPDS